jgi:hypothetical protein
MLNGRLYRVAFAPAVLALVVAGFSLTDRPRPLGSTLAPDVFDGTRAAADLSTLAARFPDRRPGSPGDDALARYVAAQLAAPPPPEVGAPAASTQHSSFSVHVRRFTARTIDGTRTLSTVVAQHPGIVNRAIVVLAHRDAAARGSPAELSGTAALLELGRLLEQRFTNRSVMLVSTSGGSGGDAGAADFAAHAGRPIDAVIVLGDMAGGRPRRPFVLPWAEDQAVAPALLQRTVEDAITSEVGAPAAGASLLTQFVHLALPFATGEQGVLNQAGVPAVAIQVSGERGPAPSEPIDANRLQNFGRAALQALNALDAGPAVPRPGPVLQFQQKLIPAWAVRLLVAVLLLPVLVATVDGFARVRRRRQPVRVWIGWTLSCGLPFFVGALFVLALRSTGILTVAPAAPAPPAAVPVHAAARAELAAAVLVIALCWAAQPALARRLGARARPSGPGAGTALLLVLGALALWTWTVNPFAAALLLPAAHLWLPLADPDLRPRRALAIALALGGALAAVGAVLLYARQLGLGPLEVPWTALLLVAGGHIGVLGAAVWSLALGCLAAAILIAVRGHEAAPPEPEGPHITVRGPVTYAGPGSLGGTESALRR